MRIALTLLTAALVSVPARAWDYESTDALTGQVVQIRTAAEFTKKWSNGLRFSLEEELRFNVFNSLYGPSFKKSYTTIDLAYAPVKYVKLDAGYSLKILGADSTWSAAKKADANEWIRHRVFFSVTGTYKFDHVKVYLRERALLEMRTDSVNPLEKNAYDWQLRSRLGAEGSLQGTALKLYGWAELSNTLNAPTYQQKYAKNDPTTGSGHQFVSHVRTQAGIKWRVSKLSTLDFYYRFTYAYDRDINITKTKGYIRLTEERLFVHSIGVSYNLDR